MFTLEQIKTAHAKVKSGADFPAYIQALKKLGIASYHTYVTDGHTAYRGTDGQKETSEPTYAPLTINNTSNSNAFVIALKNHQQGGSDYHSFCKECATYGIEKWEVDMAAMTCTYYDKAGNHILTEDIPST